MLKSWIGRGLLALAVVAGAGACTPQQMREWYQTAGVDHTVFTEEEIATHASFWTVLWQRRIELNKYNHVLDDGALWRLRECESGGNYGITSPGGTYRGAYQFSWSTWNAVAARHFPWLVGVDPAQAMPWEQDAMTRALFSTNGRAPWPVCGRRI